MIKKKIKKMSDQEAKVFIGKLSRLEFDERPVEYSKGVRVALIALGYDESWVNGDFRDMLETEYDFLWDK